MNKNVLKDLALQIKGLRLQKGWTQKQLAKKLDTKQQAISRMEKIANISFKTLVKIALVFERRLEIEFV